jgi:GPH family glycoside/pentoside/hexuronide:cation symporter
VFMRERADGTGGVIERAGYLPFSIAGAVIIFTVIIISAVSTHRLIPQLKKAAPRKINLRVLASELVQPLRSRDFVVLAVGGILISILAGLDTATRIYFSLYFWELTQDQLSMMVFGTVGASFAGPVLAHFLGRRLGKKFAAAASFATAIAFMAVPIILRLVHLAPENGTRELFLMLLVTKPHSIMFIVTTAILIASLVADIVEVVEVKTGVRSEGVVISANQLFRKIVSGIGVFLAGWLLSAVDFPTDAQRGAVDEGTLRRLAFSYLPIFFALGASAMFSLFLLRGTRESHQANLETLRQREAKLLAEGEA